MSTDVSSAREAAMPADPSSESRPRAFRVVIVDDTPDVRDLLGLVIGRAPDFTVVAEAGDGREGIAVATREQPDVVLLDLAMPEMDGLEALPHLRTALPGAAIVVLSGFQAAALGAQALEAGADGYVEKGTPARDLLARLRELVGLRFPEARSTVASDPAAPCAPQPAPSPPAAVGPGTPAAADPDGGVGEVERLRRAISTITHEFSNPVTVLHGVLEEFQNDGLTPERRERLVAALARQVHQLDQMCTDLLTAGRVGDGRLAVDLVEFDLLDMLRDITSERTELTLRTDPATARLPVLADPGRVEQILTNLISNAIRYGAPPVEVRARLADTGRVHVSVADRGPGVPADFRPHLFDEFARADTEDRIAGNGLGLYVVRHLAEAHGGRAVHEDQPGGGTVFTVDLASADPAAARAAEAG